nr:type IV secretory system conjugative DNA transfer family protein [uncultured Oscillibacter sp.]
MIEQMTPLIIAAIAFGAAIMFISTLSNNTSLNGIKSKTVGDGQHGTARWATKNEVKETFAHIPFTVREWRSGKNRPEQQGLVLGSMKKKKHLTALVDSDDIHCLMIGASGVGKTAFFLYPNLEYACASGMSFLALDTKGDLARNYGTIARKYYDYKVSVIDLRNPTLSDGNNLLTLINRYMDIARTDANNLSARAKAEKYAKILAKTIISPDDNTNYGQNAFFYDAAEGLLTSTILLLAEFLPPTEENPTECRHIVSVFKLVQDLLEPSKVKGKSQFQLLMNKLPPDHKARWFAGAALNSADQAMASVMSTVLSRLNAFLDSELEQVLCFDSAIDAETFAAEKCAIFLILPEEDTTKNFMAGLMIQNLSRELFSVADENGGKLKNRVVLFCDELGTMPPFDILPLFSAGRSRRLTLVPIIQSLAQLEKNYGKEGCEIIQDNCQDTIFGGFAPNSQTAEVLSKALGSRTVLSGSVTKGKDSNSQSLQMAERPLMSSDELKSLPKGEFIVMKTGRHPMRTRLRLFLDWGITFENPYTVPERTDRKVAYAGRLELERNILRQYSVISTKKEIEVVEEPSSESRKSSMTPEQRERNRRLRNQMRRQQKQGQEQQSMSHVKS